MKIKENNLLGELGSAIGKGLLAGIAGTAAITLSQMIEMRITKRKPSDATVKVADEVTGVKPANEEEKEKVSNEIHWAYGTTWGVARGLLSLTGLKGLPATLIHFAAIWGAELVMLPAYKVAPPVTEQDPKATAIDALHHSIYAIAAGLAFDALDSGSKNQRKLDKLISKLHIQGILKKI